LGGIKVAFLSDLHIKNIGLREKKVLEILGEEKPGLILLGGDYITFRGSYQPAISFLQELQANHGIYAVMGNTDYSNENGSCILCHKKKSKKLKDGSNLIFLRNFATPLQLNGKVLNLIGLDDPVNKKADLTAALQYRSTAAPQDGSKVAAPRPMLFTAALCYYPILRRFSKKRQIAVSISFSAAIRMADKSFLPNICENLFISGRPSNSPKVFIRIKRRLCTWVAG